ncbi:hypothetical protein RI367_004004 [Sorochytrium milnesiophthora]
MILLKNTDPTSAENRPNEPGKAGPVLDEVAIEMYETRLKDLQEKLNRSYVLLLPQSGNLLTQPALHRSKDKCTALQTDNEMLLKAQTKSVSEKQDIVEFLRIELANYEKNLAMVEERLAQVEQENQALVRSHASEVDTLNDHAKQDRDAMAARLTKLLTELGELSEFRGKKGVLEAELQGLVTELEQRERAHKVDLNAMERKFLQDKHQLRKDMIMRVNDAVASFRQVADNQMAETTKRAIRENLQITSQLRKMSAKTVELMAENEQLRVSNMKLKMDNSISTETQQELAKKSKTSQIIVRKLLKKLRELGHETVIDDIGPIPALLADTSTMKPKEVQSPGGGHRPQSAKSPSTAVTKELAELRQENGQLQAYAERTHELVSTLCDQLLSVYKEQGTPRNNKSPAKPTNEDFTYRPVRTLVNDLRAMRASITLHYPGSPNAPGRPAAASHAMSPPRHGGVDHDTGFAPAVEEDESDRQSGSGGNGSTGRSPEHYGKNKSPRKAAPMSPKDISTRPRRITLDAV